jgi:hypothetical protein
MAETDLRAQKQKAISRQDKQLSRFQVWLRTMQLVTMPSLLQSNV